MYIFATLASEDELFEELRKVYPDANEDEISEFMDIAIEDGAETQEDVIRVVGELLNQ